MFPDQRKGNHTTSQQSMDSTVRINAMEKLLLRNCYFMDTHKPTVTVLRVHPATLQAIPRR